MTHFKIETRPVKHDKNLPAPLRSAASVATAGEAREVSSQQRHRYKLVKRSLRRPETPKREAEDKMASSWDCVLRRRTVRLG